MHIAVCLTMLADPETVEVDPLTGGVDLSRTLAMLNPADAAALEMALRLRGDGEDRGWGNRVTALTVGPEETDLVLRDALAVGADAVLRLWEEGRTATNPAVTARLLATALSMAEGPEGLPDLVLCGTRSLAAGSGQVPALLAEHLGWPVVTDVLGFSLGDSCAAFERRLARGARAQGEVVLPAVIAIEPGTAPLRYAGLPELIAARRAAIPVRLLPELGLSPMDLGFPSPTVQVAMPPYPRPRELFVPDGGLPAHERAAQILSAGVAQKAGRVVEGSAEDMADAIIAVLAKHSVLDRPA